MRARRGYVAPDLRFHKALAAAAHRPILERIMTCLSDSVVALMDAVKPDVHDWDSSYRIHERILGAIRARRPGLARKLMTRHHDMMLDELEEAGLLEQGR
jgi:DNA-binding FadR family transcriptional regulator